MPLLCEMGRRPWGSQIRAASPFVKSLGATSASEHPLQAMGPAAICRWEDGVGGGLGRPRGGRGQEVTVPACLETAGTSQPGEGSGEEKGGLEIGSLRERAISINFFFSIVV